MKEFLIKEHVFGVDCRVYVGPCKKYQKRFWKRYRVEKDDESGNAGGCTMVELKNGAAEGVIWMEKFNRKNNRNLGTLSHECTHLALDIAVRCGFLPASFETQEPVVYLHTFFFEEALRRLRK